MVMYGYVSLLEGNDGYNDGYIIYDKLTYGTWK